MPLTTEDMRKNKANEITKAIAHIKSILRIVNPQKAKRWRIEYKYMNNEAYDEISDFDKNYHGIYRREEYLLIYDEISMLYAINVSANSVLYTVKALMDKIADKF